MYDNTSPIVSPVTPTLGPSWYHWGWECTGEGGVGVRGGGGTGELRVGFGV